MQCGRLFIVSSNLYSKVTDVLWASCRIGVNKFVWILIREWCDNSSRYWPTSCFGWRSSRCANDCCSRSQKDALRLLVGSQLWRWTGYPRTGYHEGRQRLSGAYSSIEISHYQSGGLQRHPFLLRSATLLLSDAVSTWSIRPSWFLPGFLKVR